MKISHIVTAAVFSLGITGSAWAGDITVSDAWARASMGMARAGAAFVTLKNTGKVDDRLVSAEANISKKVELHTHLMGDGIMRMRQVDGVDVPAGSVTELKPGGFHIMFIGLNKPLKEGNTFALKLNFAKAGSVDTTVSIKAGGARTMDHSKMNMKMDMKKDMKEKMKMPQ